jgi:drug/metabolite transporter (DMT)-like permease
MNPYLEVLLAAAIWGSSGTFIKLIALNSFQLSSFRMGIPMLILSVYFIITQNNVFKRDNRMAFLASFLNAIRMFLYFVGFTHTSIGNAVIILYTWPIFVTLFSSFMLNDRITKPKMIALLVAFSGIVMMYIKYKISFESSDFIGMSAILLSACIYSLSIIVFKKDSDKYSKIEITYFQNFIGAFMFLPFLFIYKPFPSLEKLSLMTAYAVLVGLVGFTLFFAALKKIKASVASNLAYFEIVCAITYSVIILNEKITWNMVVGGILIISSVLIVQRYNKQLEQMQD